jgi:hypothetical protein
MGGGETELEPGPPLAGAANDIEGAHSVQVPARSETLGVLNFDDEIAPSVTIVQPATPPVVTLPPAPKRPDTLFDEVIPRADEEAVSAIREALQGLVATREALMRDTEREVVELARIVAERVIARELSIDPSVVVGLVREGLGALSAQDRVTIRLGPFFEEVREEVNEVVARLGVDAEVVIDPSVGAYGCTIHTEWGRVDESIERRLRTMLERLSILPPKPTSTRR